MSPEPTSSMSDRSAFTCFSSTSPDPTSDTFTWSQITLSKSMSPLPFSEMSSMSVSSSCSQSKSPEPFNSMPMKSGEVTNTVTFLLSATPKLMRLFSPFMFTTSLLPSTLVSTSFITSAGAFTSTEKESACWYFTSIDPSSSMRSKPLSPRLSSVWSSTLESVVFTPLHAVSMPATTIAKITFFISTFLLGFFLSVRRDELPISCKDTKKSLKMQYYSRKFRTFHLW